MTRWPGRSAFASVAEAVRLWNRFYCDPTLAHPLDRDQQPGTDLISMDVASCSFEPWENFRTNIRPEGEDPLYVPDAVDTFYHDWQALLVADALDMGTRVVFDTRRPDLMKLGAPLRLKPGSETFFTVDDLSFTPRHEPPRDQEDRTDCPEIA